LIGTQGPFARAHIIPDAFMQRATDAPFLECAGESRPRRRFTGWYDPTIIGFEGERLLAEYDDAAAKCFIENGFTYRTRRNPQDIYRLGDRFVPGELYEIGNVDTGRIRLFALSLLWRAAVTSLEAFELVEASPSHLADIRRRLVARDAGPHTEYPVYFGVFCDAEELTKVAPYRVRNHPFFRFFLDGIVCYVCPRRRLRNVEDYGLLLTGSEPDRLRLLCYSSIDSAHARYTERAMQDVAAVRGDIFQGFKHAANRRR
jgi:hypothetical protein